MNPNGNGNNNNLSQLQIQQILQQQQQMGGMINPFMLLNQQGGNSSGGMGNGMMGINPSNLAGFQGGQNNMTGNFNTPSTSANNNSNNGVMGLVRASTPTSTSTTTTTSNVIPSVNNTPNTNTNPQSGNPNSMLMALMQASQGNPTLMPLLFQLQNNPQIFQLLQALHSSGVNITPQMLQAIIMNPNLIQTLLQGSNTGAMNMNVTPNNNNTTTTHVNIHQPSASSIQRSTPTSSASTPPPNLIHQNGNSTITPNGMLNLNNPVTNNQIISSQPNTMNMSSNINILANNPVNNPVRHPPFKTEPVVGTKIEGFNPNQPGNSFVTMNNANQNHDMYSQKDKKKLALDPDYKTPFRSIDDSIKRLEPFKEAFYYSIKKDPNWDEKIKSVAEKFSKQAKIAEKHVNDVIFRELDRYIPIEQDIFVQRKIFELEKQAWEKEKEELMRRKEEDNKKPSNVGGDQSVIISSGEVEDPSLEALFREITPQNLNQSLNTTIQQTQSQYNSDELDFDKIFSDEDNNNNSSLYQNFSLQNEDEFFE
ncbi:predicted protein [Naegleria gruberi]|uniref:Predicted protein n=1 Tax=Naegleria gruberi TaxID=5762 RepID=D2VJE8_NAEGR|nr:uncharacterized protein NAEGRDRAFT_69013 [Naegleria gruberi]EFC43029.1 predicted protein [Naegleria gruberi]|eukprot:XP_002675773.1 predicted protein [Naegleria gruberi strain NEG-M]